MIIMAVVVKGVGVVMPVLVPVLLHVHCAVPAATVTTVVVVHQQRPPDFVVGLVVVSRCFTVRVLV
jgi:uncharacterized membrane protein